MFLALLDLMLKFGSFLTPKDIQDSGPAQLWRNRISGWVILLTLLTLAFFIWTTQTFLPRAEADEIHEEIKAQVQEVNKSLKTIIDTTEKAELRQLRTTILQTTIDACKAPADSILRNQLFRQISELRSDYMAKTGEEYPPLPCSELTGL